MIEQIWVVVAIVFYSFAFYFLFIDKEFDSKFDFRNWQKLLAWVLWPFILTIALAMCALDWLRK